MIQGLNIKSTKIKVKQESLDGTIKYLIEYPDGECVETVLMRFDNRANLTACVSSQVGCAVNCSFCATGKRGFIRNLSYTEIIEQNGCNTDASGKTLVFCQRGHKYADGN